MIFYFGRVVICVERLATNAFKRMPPNLAFHIKLYIYIIYIPVIAIKSFIVLFQRMFEIIEKSLVTDLKAMNCPPSWIIEDMDVTSQVGSRTVFILTAGDQHEPQLVFGCYHNF